MDKGYYYLRVNGGRHRVVGDSTERLHRGWIELVRFEFRPVQSGTSGRDGGRGAKPALYFALERGPASIGLFRAQVDGAHFDSAILEIGGERDKPTGLVYTLEDVTVSSFDPGSGAELLDELSVSYAKLHYGPSRSGIVVSVAQAIAMISRGGK